MRLSFMISMVVYLVLSGAVWADPFANKSNRSSFFSKTKILDTRAAKQYKSSVRLRPKSVSYAILPKYSGEYKGQYLDAARHAARSNGVPEDLFLRLVQQESNWNPVAKSHKGALGLAQLLPQTAQGLGVDPLNPKENLHGGAKYLAQQYRTFGSWHLALAAYNAGPGAVLKYGGIPPYKETQNYVRKIMGS